MTTIYVLRDRDTQGADFCLWGDNLTAAIVSLVHCSLDRIEVELRSARFETKPAQLSSADLRTICE